MVWTQVKQKQKTIQHKLNYHYKKVQLQKIMYIFEKRFNLVISAEVSAY